MNRLIIIGNGFDRAHGLKTGYFDFMSTFLLNSLNEVSQNDSMVVDNALFSLQRLIPNRLRVNVSDMSYFQGIMVDRRGKYIKPSPQTQVQAEYRFQPKSAFVYELVNNCCDYNWVDIENVFYRYLTDTYRAPREKQRESVQLLNAQLECLKQKLGKYLNELPPVKAMQAFKEIINPDMGHLQSISSSLMLNFNYTNVGQMYETNGTQSVHIHGKLDDPDNPLIFGFGDELDEMYGDFKRDESYGYTEHLKSFLYPLTDNFTKLDTFMGRLPAARSHFEAVILGHSCGRSDRTLLNYIFEQPNCVSIRAYYYQEPGVDPRKCFRKLTDNIARQFNTSRYYAKVVSFMQSQQMPQFK